MSGGRAVGTVVERLLTTERSPGGIWGWHWLAEDGALAHTKPPMQVRAGSTYQVDGEIVVCAHGLHGSEYALDALAYAPGARLCRTYHHGVIRRDAAGTKLASTDRDVLWVVDATRTLHEFALWCAENALALVPTPDPRSVAALAVKRRWLDGDADAGELAAAWDAARDAARDAAWDAARTAQRQELERRCLALGPVAQQTTGSAPDEGEEP